MQTGIATGSVGRGRKVQFLRNQDVEGSKALPYAVYGGRVYSFKLDFDDVRAFSGELLKLGNDGRVYAVFADESEAERNEKYFRGCALTCFNGFMNAYCLGSAR